MGIRGVSGELAGRSAQHRMGLRADAAARLAQRLKLRSELVNKDAGAGMVSGSDMLFSP